MSRGLSIDDDALARQVFRMLEQEPKGVKCPAIDGLIAEADELAGEVADKQVLDAAIVGSAQAVEHYEIARYGTLIAWADELGRDDIALDDQSQRRESRR
jgi:ferritin-like metal-binding protein YciE